MNEVTTQPQIVIGIITIIVFYFLTKKTIENINYTNDDDNTNL